jgi:hypothetical protein
MPGGRQEHAEEESGSIDDHRLHRERGRQVRWLSSR